MWTVIEVVLEVVWLGGGRILVISDMRYFDLGRKNGEDIVGRIESVFFWKGWRGDRVSVAVSPAVDL
jgi:hypothetical protein